MYSLASEVHVQFVYSFNTRLYCFNKLHHYNANALQAMQGRISSWAQLCDQPVRVVLPILEISDSTDVSQTLTTL